MEFLALSSTCAKLEGQILLRYLRLSLLASSSQYSFVCDMLRDQLTCIRPGLKVTLSSCGTHLKQNIFGQLLSST